MQGDCLMFTLENCWIAQWHLSICSVHTVRRTAHTHTHTICSKFEFQWCCYIGVAAAVVVIAIIIMDKIEFYDKIFEIHKR